MKIFKDPGGYQIKNYILEIAQHERTVYNVPQEIKEQYKSKDLVFTVRVYKKGDDNETSR